MIEVNRREAFLKAPDAVLFDLDNTLYPYDPAHQAAMVAVRGKIHRLFNVEGERFQEIFEVARAEVKARLLGTAGAHSRLLYFQRAFELMGLKAQLLHALDFEHTYWRVFLSNARLFAGVRDLLDDIRLAGVPTALVTDLTAQIQFRKLVYFGLDHFFDSVVTSEESGADKPAPASFKLALSKLQPKGDRVWFIGDSASIDLAGARGAVSATTLQKIHAGVERGRAPDTVDAFFSDYEDLRGLLARALQGGTGA